MEAAGARRATTDQEQRGQKPRRPSPVGSAMVARIIELCALNRFLGPGRRGHDRRPRCGRSGRAKLDAIPDLTDPRSSSSPSGWAARPTLVEDQVTYPDGRAVLAAPRVTDVRGFSMFGMSFVYVIFEEGTDLYWARSRVLEYLERIRARLPEGVDTRHWARMPPAAAGCSSTRWWTPAGSTTCTSCVRSRTSPCVMRWARCQASRR